LQVYEFCYKKLQPEDLSFSCCSILVESQDLEKEEPSLRLADKICSSLFSSYTIDEIMDIVREHRDKSVFIYVRRDDPASVRILVDSNGKHCYRCGRILMVPIPKKFVLLEPDKLYFEMTLKANIMLALRGAQERELHH